MPDGAVVVPDPNLIFYGEFKRAGLDLVLSHEGRDVVVHDYFRGDKRAAIASPDGAHLTGDIVNALTGHVQYAQAAPGVATAQVIGHVTKLSGSATAIRNGVSVALNNGDNVEKGDVVSTGADSTLGITFIDGTVFGLSSNARMVLNEMVYDPNGSNNSSLLSLVAGTITFVAGETAKHGDMKVDTPVATMGIRGTAVLNQINFVVPVGGGDPQPQVSFQVLVEPNGTTGSYILFDKVTLLPIATVNQAGQMIQISGGNVSISNALMSPDVQKLITDVFTLKFTDNNSNTKLTTNFTDTITPGATQELMFKSASGDVAIATFTNLNHTGSAGPGDSQPTAERIPGQPLARSLDLGGNVTTAFSLSERAGTTGDTTHSDTISGRITFVDQNLGDLPTVSISLAEAPNYVYKNAGQQDVTGSLSALQKQDIAATLIQISVAPDGGNNNNGSAVWTYTIPDNVFDFLAAGETLTLTYMVRVDTNFQVNPESAFIPITITITGTNDKPVITSSVPTITFEGGTSVPGGPLVSDEATSGTLNFADVDLTDTHTVSVALTSATLPDGSTVPPGPLAAFQSAMSVAIASGADSTGDGTGTINWSLADLPVYLADFIPRGEVLTLVYTVTVTDAQGATAQQTITVTITGTDAPAVVWIATEKPGAPSGGFWKDAANWATGTVPTIDDDVIVITDQLHGLTPSFPATIDAPAYAKSVTMNDFGGPPPQLINRSSLTIAGSLDMGADSIFTNAATGTASIGGLAEILDTSVFTNAGYLTLKAGGDFAVGTTITNSGTLELFGGTLKTLAEIHNAGGTLKTDAGATLIVDGTTVDGGTVTILGTLELDGVSLIENGTLNNSGTINVKGTAEFAGETVDNAASGVIEVLANGWLTIHQGSSVTNAGQITIDASGRLVVNNATIGGAGEVIGTLDGEGEDGPIFNAGAGTITSNGEIDLTGDAVLSGGILNNNAVFNVSGTGNALSDETVTNAGIIEVLAGGALAIDLGSTVDNSSGNVIIDGNAALTLDDTTISGGAIKGVGTIDVTGASRIDGGATLSISTVTVDAELTLDGITVSGTEITDNSSIVLGGTVKLKGGANIQGGPVTNLGTLEIAGAATLLNDVVTNTGTIAVDDGQTLTLSGTEISGGAINGSGTIDVTGASKIDGGATLSNGAVTVESGITLTLGDATVAGAAIANHGAVKVDAGETLTLSAAGLTGGALTVQGTVKSTGATTITDASVTNNGLIEAIGGVLTLATMTSASIANAGTLRANGAELDIDHQAVTNSGTLAAINGGTLKLIATTVTGAAGAVSVGSASTLDLVGTVIDGGTVTIAGTLESTGTSAIDNAGITNTGTIAVAGGTLTIDPATIHAITNQGLIEAVTGGTLKLTAAIITNTGGTISVDDTSKLYLTNVSINGGSLSNAGNLYSVSGSNTITAGVTNTGGTIEVQAGTLNLAGGITGPGTLIVDDGAKLELGGADAQTVTFAGGTGTLQLDKVAGQSFTGTIAGEAAADGTFTVTGDADITASVGNALDFAVSNGTNASIVLTLTGKATGTGANSVGVLVENSNAANGGDISITQLGGAVGGAYGIDALTQGSGDITIDAGGVITGSSIYGIRSRSYGTGDQTVTTETGSVLTSGSSGIVAVNRATSIGAAASSTITVNAYGTINSGSSPNLSGNTPAGIQTGYTGATNGTNATTAVNGSVVVNNHANITAAAGYGIHAYNYGNGDVTVNDAAGTTIVGAEEGIRAQALSGGTGNIAVTLGANASVTGTTSYGILAYSVDQGDISVTLAAGDHVTSGSSGVVAVNYAVAIDDDVGSTISVEAHGTIHSGSALNNDLTTPGAIIAGYKPGGNGTFSGAVNGDVVVTSDATITADAGYGIEAFTWGVGDVTVTTGATSQITAAGTAIGAFNHGGGDVTVTNDGSATGAIGLSALAAGAGDVTIVNHGSITGTSSVGIRVTQNDADAAGDPVATGSTHITNNGSIVGATGHAAIFIQENATGFATIDNSGTIGPAVASSVTSATYAIVETGGAAITITNTGHINGNISAVSATFYNNAGGIWTVSGTSVFGNVSSIVNGGEIDLLSGAAISVAGLGITNTNEIESWGTASITGTITNNHSIEVHTGTLTLFDSLSGSGSVTIDAGATLEIKSTVAQTITFAGAGAGAELQIDTTTFGGSIFGFAAFEKIDLSTFTWDSGSTAVYDAMTGNLVVSDTHDHSFTLKLIGDYSEAHFITSSDGNGGTIVEIAPVDEWIYPLGGDWNTASNWSVGVPGASYDVKLLAAGEPYTVDSATNVTIHDLTVDSGVTLLTEPGTVFTVKGEVVLDGLIEAGPFSGDDVSTIDIKGNVTGTGAIEISNKAVVEIEGSVSGVTVFYDNGLGTLILDDSKHFHGLISGSSDGAPLSSNNLIDLKDLAWTSNMSAQADYNADTNITTVGFYNGATTVTLSFLGRDVNWHLQSDGQGGTTVYDPLADAPMTIESGTVLNLSEASSQDVTFANDSGTTGTLAIEHAADFTGTINGFAGDGTVANSDLLDLKDIDFSTLTGATYTENADHLGGVLTLSDGTDTATIKFAGSYSIDSFQFVSDGNGGTLVVDPPTGPTLVGTSGQDQFAFTNSTLPVQSTIVDFELGQDKIDLREFAGIKSFSDIVITQQAGGTLVTLDDHQSILLKNLVASSLHASDFIVANHA
ncbi:FecR domain-containing protein [Bradyrhizobium iriomotense]|nr:FecR domain-containing protein [Bradyrhizobium iriomotense]